MERIFITGANRGIGFEIVRQVLEKSDARIFAACRTPESASALQTLAQNYTNRLEIIPLEVTNAESIRAAAQMVAQYVDGIDILINNAGVDLSDSEQRLETVTFDRMLEVFQINAAAPVMIVQAFLDLLNDGKNTRIINITSEMGSIGERDYGGNYAYCTSKAALNMITKGMSVDLGRKGMIVVALDPGWVKTDMGGPSASLTPEESVSGILSVVSGLSTKDNGSYLRWNGDTLPW